MGRFVIICISGSKAGLYVQRPGSSHSYGTLGNAQRFRSRELAVGSCCGNERVVDLLSIIFG